MVVIMVQEVNLQTITGELQPRSSRLIMILSVQCAALSSQRRNYVCGQRGGPGRAPNQHTPCYPVRTLLTWEITHLSAQSGADVSLLCQLPGQHFALHDLSD